ncbi:hypothetical protein BSKO_09934 [Bryopsis sp. KO-2023]|nr:hypothetical protein BSKO_09934 [Bryopsis sp. KO-2023]
MLTTLEVYVEALDLDDADVECGQGVLTLKLGEKGTFVINKQSPNKQIWLSSPISGPFRYDYLNGNWTYGRDGHLLKQKLASELEELCGKPVDL